ncbi:MAG TPA: hypothetical protein VF749_00455 [Candidatus Acidoferrum sp.]
MASSLAFDGLPAFDVSPLRYAAAAGEEQGCRGENYNENLAGRPGFYALRNIAQRVVHDLATFKG